MDLQALEAMFLDHEGMPARSALKIPDHYTTNPQAEILVLNPINKSYITEIILDSANRIRDYRRHDEIIAPFKKSFKFSHDSSYFYARPDCAHWRQVENG